MSFTPSFYLIIVMVISYFYAVHPINTECGVSPTIDKHDQHCTYSASISLSSSSSKASSTLLFSSDYTDKWQISYQSVLESSLLFEQFVYIKITTSIDTALFIATLIRETCSYSFQTDLSFKSAPSHDDTQMIYTVVLPSCNTQSIELCTYYVVIEASNEFIHKAEKNMNQNQTLFSASYDLTASLGILLQFQQKYSYLPASFGGGDTDTEDDTQTDKATDTSDDDATDRLTGSESDIANTTCLWHQLYAVKASLTDFPIGIIVQPEWIDTDAGFTISEYTSTPLTEIKSKVVDKLKGDAESESYGVPSIGGYRSSDDYILIRIEFYLTENTQDVRNLLPNKNVKYIIYSQSNISYIQVSVINSGGWFLLLVLVVLILIAMCRKHCCLRDNNEGLSYNDFIENIQVTSPLFINVNANANSSNAEDQKSIGVPLDELDKVSVIQTFHKNDYKYKACCICLYDYKNNEKIRKLNCNHYFHQKCIDIWFMKNIHCPLCKQFVISATILSKLSANSPDTSTATSTSTSTHSVSVSVSTSKSSSSDANETHDLLETKQEEEEDGEHPMNVYSLSDSHCIYNAKSEKQSIHTKYVSDDMYIAKHSNPNIIARHRNKSWSGSYHSSRSSNNPPQRTHHNTNTNTATTTVTPNTNDISISISAPTDGIPFNPLAPSINLYFDNTFRAQSTSTNRKKE